ncbi:MAG: hypothetical protein KDE31_35815, partial [Caldilineaceae bacterium]|nr:hypothetical protein [Caldilineaceae bacterium]
MAPRFGMPEETTSPPPATAWLPLMVLLTIVIVGTLPELVACLAAKKMPPPNPRVVLPENV